MVPLRLLETVDVDPECHGDSTCADQCAGARAVAPGSYQLVLSLGKSCRGYESDPPDPCTICFEMCELEDSVTDPEREVVVDVELPADGPVVVTIEP